jgi:uncharacterized protein involved in exopolysaccharide biosynthesis
MTRTDVRRAGVIVVGTAAAALILSLLLPTWYSASATLTVDANPSVNVGGAGMLGLASQLGLAGGIGTGTGSAQYFADVLASPAVTDPVALGAIPQTPDGTSRNSFGSPGRNASPRERDAARRKFAGHFGTLVNARTSTITFNVEGRTPYAAKSSADTLLGRLNSVIIDLRRRRASAERAFVERRLDSASSRQAALEDTLRWFYATNRMIANSPNLQFAEARLKRRVDFSLDLANQLRTQLETAKLQEVRDTPVLSVITPPEIPGRKSAPNRRLIVVAALIFGSAIAAFDYALRNRLLDRFIAR